ncbi:RNA polymerase sigma factor [Steroidobacter sp.]|uniref:RNA polymerase sigma factor n=1 Tax=Steroidobacter sp. TaxID=1978227 RepID=UPI001A3F05A2|nr:RNA polymerase sigma factor [Steroidobacter sp.]MBL8271733.1 RNA polymerase sigma factor [Steroidobacter sp.]
MEGVRLLLSKMRRLLMSRGRAGDEIDDLMQEAFLRLQVYCRDRVVQNTEAFLIRTVLNLSAEHGRKVRAERLSDDEEAMTTVIDPTPAVDEIYAAQQRLLRFKEGLQRLHPKSREAFLMHRMDGMSYVQIAEEFGVTVSMVEKHIARASFFLRDWMTRGGQ